MRDFAFSWCYYINCFVSRRIHFFLSVELTSNQVHEVFLVFTCIFCSPDTRCAYVHHFVFFRSCRSKDFFLSHRTFFLAPDSFSSACNSYFMSYSTTCRFPLFYSVLGHALSSCIRIFVSWHEDVDLTVSLFNIFFLSHSISCMQLHDVPYFFCFDLHMQVFSRYSWSRLLFSRVSSMGYVITIWLHALSCLRVTSLCRAHVVQQFMSRLFHLMNC